MNADIDIQLTDSMITAVADYVCANSDGTDFSRTAAVFGGKRPALFIKRELARRLNKPFLPPRIFSMDEFMAMVAAQEKDRVLLSPLESAFFIYRLVKKHAPHILAGRSSFAQFMPWAREIAAFIDHADQEDITPEQLQSIKHNADIGYDIPHSVNELLSVLGTVRSACHDEFEKTGVTSRGYRYLTAARAAPLTDLAESDTILFCGFFFLHKTERAVIDAFKERGKAVVIRHGAPDTWERTLVPPRNLRLYAGYDLHSQVAAVREIVKTIKEPEKTVLVLPDPGAAIPVMSEITAIAPSYNISLGYPVERTALYSLLEAIFTAQTTRQNGLYYAADYLAALRHPLAKNIMLGLAPQVTRVLVHKIEEALTGVLVSPVNGKLFVSCAEIAGDTVIIEAVQETLRAMDTTVPAATLKGAIAALHHLLFTSWEHVCSPASCGVTMESFITEIAGKSFIASYPVNISALELLRGIARQMREVSFAADVFTVKELFDLVRQVLVGEMISFTGSPLAGLQILGLLESRSLDFETVIVMNANESILPKLHIQEPLIPRDVMLAIGLDRVAKEEEIQRYHFMRLLSAAKDVHIVYADNKINEKSRFVEHLLWLHEHKVAGTAAIPITRARFAAPPVTVKAMEYKTPAMVEYLASMPWSPTRIDTYLSCPMRFYFRYVLGLDERTNLLDEPQEREIGRFIHEFLHEAFTPFIGRPPVFDELFTAGFDLTLQERFDNFFKQRMRGYGFLVKEIVTHRMKQFLSAERQRQVVTIVSLEAPLRGPITLGGHPYTFSMRLDRLDKLGDGSLLVIDYKTGGREVMPQKAALESLDDFSREAVRDSVVSFQLPLYLHFIEQMHAAPAYDAGLYDLRSGKLTTLFEGKQDRRAPIQSIVMKALEQMLTEITDPAMPFIPDVEKTKCSACPYYYACR